MGAKAKAAIQKGKTAIETLNTQTGDLLAHFQGMVLEKKTKAKVLNDLRVFVTKKYPGVADLSPYYASDAAVKRMVDQYRKTKVTIAEHKTSCRVAIVQVKAATKDVEDSQDQLYKMIGEKSTKRDQKTLNPIKKVANKLQTKSLGDLQAQYQKVRKALEDVNERAIGIIAYFEKIDKSL